MRSNTRRFIATLALLPLFAGVAEANDVSRSLRSGQDYSEEDDSYLELGLSVISQDGLRLKGDQRSFNDDVRITPAINARYQWRGWFVETQLETSAALTLGYSAYSSRDLSLDFILGPRHGSLDSDVSDELAGIDERYGDITAGMRVSGYVSDYLWQVQAWSDIGDTHDGFGGSALVGRNWQLRNWNLHALVGASYSSADTLDYYYGVTPAEASRGALSAYSAGAGVTYSAEVGLTYPLSESWIVRSTVRYGRVSDAIADSPLFEQPEKDVSAAIFNLSYVF